jgi:hypothetical protein
MAFEYGMNYGGSEGDYELGDCQPQSTAEGIVYDGTEWNLDLYVKVFGTDEEACVNDDTFGDSGGDTCSNYYVEGNESGCGNYDTEDFIAARDCCICGGGSTGYYEYNYTEY